MNYKEKLVIDLSDAVNISDLGIKITNILETDGAGNKELHLNLGSIDLKQSQLLSIKALIEAMQSLLVGVETTSEITETSAIGLGLTVGKPASQPEASAFEETFKPQVEPSFEEKVVSSDEISSFAQLKKMNSIGDFVSDAETLPEVHDDNLKEETEAFLKEAEKEEQETETSAFDGMTKEEKVANIDDSLDKEVTHEDIQDALDVTFGSGVSISEELGNSDSEKTEDVFSHVTMQDKLNDYEVTETVEKEEDGKYVLLDTEGITPEGVELIKANTSDLDTLYLTQTLRSGQTVSYEGNIFLIGDAHPGSEINATGDITVWGILGGIVHAGSKGNTDAKVRALKLNPIQLRIANLYSRRNDTVNVPYVQKTNEFTPEEARIEKGQIVIYKTLRRED